MLSSLKKGCTIGDNLNGRCQRNGKEKIPAYDLKVVLMLTKNQLQKLVGEELIWQSWFNESKTDGDQPLLKDWAAYRWGAKFENSKAVFVVGVQMKRIDCGTVTIKKMIFTPVAGGQTSLELSIGVIATVKNSEMLTWLGSTTASIELQFGELVIDSEQKDLDLEDAAEEGDEDETDDAEASAPQAPSDGDDDRPRVN